MDASYFLFGLAAGVLLTVPLAIWWNRRTARSIRYLEQQARSNERLAELGTLTGGLAHEIKNPLSTVGLNVQLIQEDLLELTEHEQVSDTMSEQLGRIHRRFDTLTRETHRLREILEDFLRFAGRMELDLLPADINNVIEEVADFFEAQAQTAGISMRRELASNAGQAMLDTTLFKQALLNLLINAVQAMSDAREKNKLHGGARDLIIRSMRQRLLGKDWLLIHVIDTGPGMDSTTREKIFQPYYSTKRGGTGLGLPTTRRIIEEHRGSIEVHSEPGKGTDFIIQLPG